MDNVQLSLRGCHGITRYYTVDATIFPDSDEEEVISCTVTTTSGEEDTNEYILDVTIVDELPEGIDEQELIDEITDKFDEL